MKKFNLLLFIFLYCLNLIGQVPIETDGAPRIDFESSGHSQYFEFDTSDTWVITDTAKQILYFEKGGIFKNEFSLMTNGSYYYKSNLSSWVQMKIVLGFSNYYEIGFRQKYDFEQNEDGGLVEISHDNGQTWNNIISDSTLNSRELTIENFYNESDTIQSSDNGPGFTGIQKSAKWSYFNFATYYSFPPDTILIRFRLVSDSVDNNNEGWIIDDIHFLAILVDIEEIKESKNNMLVYPNPAQNFLNVRLKSDESVGSLRLFSIDGKEVPISINSSDYIDITELSPGMYYLINTTNNDISYKCKFVKL